PPDKEAVGSNGGSLGRSPSRRLEPVSAPWRIPGRQSRLRRSRPLHYLSRPALLPAIAQCPHIEGRLPSPRRGFSNPRESVTARRTWRPTIFFSFPVTVSAPK